MTVAANDQRRFRGTAIDAFRSPWLDAFFETWRFESTPELIAAVRSTSVDLESFARHEDLRRRGLGSWGYWFLFLKGWLESPADPGFTDENVYWRYMTRYFDAATHDPGIADVLRDPEASRDRVLRRFADLDVVERCATTSPWAVSESVPPLQVRLSTPPTEGAKIVYEAGSHAPIGPALLDGHHRLFGVRLFGAEAMRAEIVYDSEDAVQLDIAGRIAATLRLLVPPTATAAVISTGEGRTSFGLRSSVSFPPEGRARATERELIEILEHGRRAQGWRFLVVPATAVDWYDCRRELGEHLQRYRLAACDRDRCVVHVLTAEPAAPTTSGGIDVPPSEMRLLSSGIEDPDDFVERGAMTATWVEQLLSARGAPAAGEGSIMDFGSGAGRVLRHLNSGWSRVGATDYNPYLMSWVAGNLPTVETSVCALEPRTTWSEGEWDVVLAIDVFTHLDERLQRAWIRELARITRPGGVLVLTTHGDSRAHQLSPELQERFGRGETAVIRPSLAGTNSCGAYQPETFVREVLADGLELLDHVPDGAPELSQDAVVLRRPA